MADSIVIQEADCALLSDSINVAAINLSSERPPPSLLDGWSSAAHVPDQDYLDSLPSEIKREVLGRYGRPNDQERNKRKSPHNGEDADINTKNKNKRNKKSGPGFSATQAIEVDDEPEIIEIDSSPEKIPPKSTRPRERPLDDGTAATVGLSVTSHNDNIDDDLASNDVDPEADTTYEIEDDDDEPVYETETTEGSQQTTCAKCGTVVFAFAKAAHDRWHEGDELQTT
jgi:hypothetical protein